MLLKIFIIVLLLFISADCYSSDYYVFIDRTTEEGAVLSVLPVDTQHEPTEAELGSMEVIIVDFADFKDGTKFLERYEDGHLKRTIDISKLGKKSQKEKIEKTKFDDSVVLHSDN